MQRKLLDLPGLSLVSRDDIERVHSPFKMVEYVKASLTAPSDKGVCVDFKNLEPKNPGVALQRAKGTVTQHLRRRGLLGQVKVKTAVRRFPFKLFIARTRLEPYTEDQANKLLDYSG